MRHSIELVPAEALQEDPDQEPDMAWYHRAYEVAEAELNRPVMRRLTTAFAVSIALFYVAFAAMLMWHPHA